MTRWSWLGRIAHAEVVAHMEDRRERILAGDESAMAIVLAEHPPVITLGRRGDRANIVASDGELARLGVELREASRGGDVTFHGPGQLMIYPVVRLRAGLVRFLETVAGAIADTAAAFGIDGARWRRDPAGVWLDDGKLAACGVHVRRQVAIHGFALNVSTPERYWQLIVPCGLREGRVASMAERLGAACPSVDQVAQVAGPILQTRLFDCE